MAKANLQTATNGSVRVPFDQRDGATSDVFFTRDLSPEGLRRAVAKVAPRLSGKIAIKLHTGEKDGPNIIPYRLGEGSRLQRTCPMPAIVETNTYYEGDRYTTETASARPLPSQRLDLLPGRHSGRGRRCHVPGRRTANGSTKCHVGAHHGSTTTLMLALTHFKGHTMGGFGGSNKNLGIGCADGRVGKGDDPHRARFRQPVELSPMEELMERITESTKAVADRLLWGPHRCT